MLRTILRRPRHRPDGRTGFVYVPDDESGPMRGAREGGVVRVEGRGPPWIVVDEVPEAVIIARWPGTLWKVMIVEAATADDQRGVGGPPLPHARYTRCISVELLGREDVSALFGDHGRAVMPVLARAAALTFDDAGRLSAARHPGARGAYDRTFRRWSDGEGIGVDDHGPLDGTLRIGSMPGGSPINEGLSLIHVLVFERAKTLHAARATRIDVDGEEELVAPWAGAGAALLDAGLALGAPGLVAPGDRDILLAAWTRGEG